MKVFVTGVNGYVGAVLAPYLMERGLSVLALDTGYYRDGWLYSDNRTCACSPQTINKDLRQITEQDLEGCDAVAHLAELSNDPLGQNKPEVTHRINHKGSGIARRKGAGRRYPALRLHIIVQRLRCGHRRLPGRIVPQRIRRPPMRNARCLSNGTSAEMAGPDFCPVFLRNATAYGPSPRMRFDIVLNDLSALAWTTKRIAMVSDGSPWRPLVHVEDMCEAIYRSLVAPEDAVRGKVFNVGQNSENYRIREIAQIVADGVPRLRGDRRSRAEATIAAIASTSTASTANCPDSRAATRPETVQGNCARCSSAYR